MDKNLLFIMTLSGTIVVVLYVISYPFAYKYFSIRWRYSLLKLAMIFYLIPFAYFKFVVLDYLYRLSPGLKRYLTSINKHVDTTNYIFMSNNLKVVSWQLRVIGSVVFIIGSISIIIVYKQLHGYLKIKKECLNESVCCLSEDIKKFQCIKCVLGIKESVTFLSSESYDFPFTIGAFSPAIILPSNFIGRVAEEDLLYIIKHELNHVKNKDILIRFLALLILAIHWYNPICYFLYREVCDVSELYCDFCTIKDMNPLQKKVYCNLIIDLATEGEMKGGKRYVARLVNNDIKVMERRILELKKYSGTKKVFISCLMGGAICLCGAITSFAYNPPATYDTSRMIDGEMVEILVSRNIHPTFESEVIPFDYFWTTQDGTIIELSKDSSDGKTYCPHDYESGIITEHTRYSDNSCKVVYLNGQVCSLCGSIIEGSIINTVRYDVCPH